jgi:lysophospholipase L1-like esterase
VGRADTLMVVAFGDSTTAPRIVNKKPLTVYADLLGRELPEKGLDAVVVNAGIGGHNTGHARARFARDVLAYQPNLVVIQFGINDSGVDVWKTPPATKPRVAIDRYEANLRYLIGALRARQSQVILMTPNPLRWTDKLKAMYGKPPYKPDDPNGFNVLLHRYAGVVRQIAQQEKLPLIDIYATFEKHGQAEGHSTDELLLDGMHPNAKGHRMIADLLFAQINQMYSDGKRVGRPWKRCGPGVVLHPDCTDISHDTPHDCVFGPGVARLDNRTVMTVYSNMNPYGQPGSTWIACRLTHDGGKTWMPERQIVRHPECKACHPSVLVTRDGVIHVVYLGFKKHVWKDGNPTPEDQSDIWTIRSHDRGKTWSHRQRIYTGYSGATNGLIETRGGHIVVPFSHYVSNPGRLVSCTAVSPDGGKTWKLSNALDIGGAGDHDGAIEPAVIERTDGRIWMLIRTTRGQFWQSLSTDGGLTWSKATPTPIAATSAPGHLTRLADGRLALVWNPNRAARRELRLAISDDEGKTWGQSIVLAKGKQVTYPFIFEVKRGELWVGFHDLYNGWGRQRAKIVKVPARLLGAG